MSRVFGLAALLCGVFVLPVWGSCWGPRNCAPVGVPEGHWVVSEKDPRDLAYYSDGRQIAYYNLESNKFYWYKHNMWYRARAPWLKGCVDGCPCNCCGDDCRCTKPCCDGCLCVVEANVDLKKNPGVVSEKLSKTERCCVNGVEVSLRSVVDALGTVPDDAKTPSLTVIGTPEQRATVAKDLKDSNLAFLFQGYAPDNWATRPGFVTKGQPTVYIQKPDGTVLHRQDEYYGPEKMVEAVRVANKDYDPKKDPNLVAPNEGKFPFIPVAVGVCGAVLVSLFRRDEDV